MYDQTMTTLTKSFRLDEADRDILERWSEALGLHEADVLRLALRSFDTIDLSIAQIAALAAASRTGLTKRIVILLGKAIEAKKRKRRLRDTLDLIDASGDPTMQD